MLTNFASKAAIALSCLLILLPSPYSLSSTHTSHFLHLHGKATSNLCALSEKSFTDYLIMMMKPNNPEHKSQLQESINNVDLTLEDLEFYQTALNSSNKTEKLQKQWNDLKDLLLRNPDQESVLDAYKASEQFLINCESLNNDNKGI